MATCVACQAPAHTWRLTGGHYGERALFSVDCVSMQIQCAKKYGSGAASATTTYFKFLVEFNLAKTSKNVGTYPKWWEWWIWWHFFFSRHVDTNTLYTYEHCGTLYTKAHYDTNTALVTTLRHLHQHWLNLLWLTIAAWLTTTWFSLESSPNSPTQPRVWHKHGYLFWVLPYITAMRASMYPVQDQTCTVAHLCSL